MFYLKARKQKKKIRCKTEGNEQLQEKLRTSISDGVKQRLIQISSINNIGQSRDWTLEQDYQTILLQPFQRRYEQHIRKDIKLDRRKGSAVKNGKLQQTKWKEADRRKFNKTECSVRQEGGQTIKLGCSPITLQFQRLNKQKELRIHSNGQVSIDFDNNPNFNISEKIFRQAANKYKGSNKNKLTSPYYCKRTNQIKNNKYTPIIPHKKLAYNAIGRTQIDQLAIHRLRENNLFKNGLSRKKQFLDLSTMLMEERRNIFYPTKANLTNKAK